MANASEPSRDEVTAKTCNNCGAVADGSYCPNCGQETKLRLPTLREFMREAAGRYVSIDGRFWRSIVALLARPGFLTREYLIGRRRRYIRPARLYLFTTLIFFGVSRLFLTPIEMLDIRADTTDESKYLSADKGFDLQMDPEQTIMPPALQKRWNRFNHLGKNEKAEQLRDGALRYAPYAMFVLLPAFALLLKLVYLGRRRRRPHRPRLYGEHLVFAAYNHAFIFLAATAMLLMPWHAPSAGIALWMVAYLLWSMRAVYGGSWLGVFARSFVLVTSYTVLVALATAGLLVAAILLR